MSNNLKLEILMLNFQRFFHSSNLLRKNIKDTIFFIEKKGAVVFKEKNIIAT